MTVQTLTLTDFLLARIAEDEAEAEKVQVPVRNGSLLGVMRLDVKPHDSPGSHDGPAVAIVVSPTRVLAECEAKRRIVELADEATGLDMNVDNARRVGVRDMDAEPWLGDLMLAALALPYADHPDFREEWKP